MLLPWMRTLMVPMSSDIHSTTWNTNTFLLELSLALQSCEPSLSDHYEDGLGNGAQQSTELVRSAVDPGSANPEFTSECL